MNTQEKSGTDYERSVIVNSSMELVFKALTEEIDKWWSSIENTSKKVGDIFKISFGAESYWKFKVLAADKSTRIVWKCVESHQDHNLAGIDKEWLHSTLYWNISDQKGKIKIQFIHKGLVSTGICYEVCSAGWDFYILDSLKNYLETGVGKVREK